MKMRQLGWACGALALLVGGLAFAEAAVTSDDDPVFYGGQLLDGDGKPVEDGVYPVVVALMKKATDASAFVVCTPDSTAVQTVAGHFRLALNTACKTELTKQPHLFVVVTVELSKGTPTVFPPAEIGSVAHALRADQAQAAAGLTGLVKTELDAIAGAVGIYNVGLMIDAQHRLTIVQANGSPLNTESASWLVMPTASGEGFATLKRFPITGADHWFGDGFGTANSTAGMPFGTTTKIAWGWDVGAKQARPKEARPFFLFAIVSAKGAVRFGISPDPTLRRTPATANVGARNTPPANNATDQAMLLLGPKSEISAYSDRPALAIGSLRMVKTNADDSWLIVPPDDGDGIGRFQSARWFLMPTGQMGAATAKYTLDKSPPSEVGPSWDKQSIWYRLGTDGLVDLRIRLGGGGAKVITANGNGGLAGDRPHEASFTLSHPFELT